MITAVASVESRPAPGSVVPAASDRLAWVRYGSPTILDGSIAFLEPIQVGVSKFQELRKECPFNVFIGKLLDFGKLRIRGVRSPSVQRDLIFFT